jgi:hypothetical protein
MKALTPRNKQLQDYFVFSDGFEVLFQIILGEGAQTDDPTSMAPECLQVVLLLMCGPGSAMRKKLFVQSPQFKLSSQLLTISGQNPFRLPDFMS